LYFVFYFSQFSFAIIKILIFVVVQFLKIQIVSARYGVRFGQVNPHEF
jgi:hypothetical protein